MKFKKIKVFKYQHTDDFGKMIFPSIEILFDPSENEITAENFDQKKHEYSLTATEIDRISQISARRFYDENIKDVRSGKKTLSAREINGVKEFLKLNGVDFGKLIGLDKSSISRLLSKNQTPQKDKMILIMERIHEELDHPGVNKIILENLYLDSKSVVSVEKICLPAGSVAEYFIRKFSKTDSPITHLKLQKLLYYAQGIGFGRCNLKLLKEPLLAWEHGPVIKEVYDIYKSHDKNPLPENEKVNLDSLLKNEIVINILEETVSLYGIYDAWFLRSKTHQEKPWLETAKDAVISDELMMGFFKKVLV